MKKTMAVLMVLVFVLSSLSSCAKQPTKMLFYDTLLKPSERLLYISSGSGSLSGVLPGWRNYVSPNGDQIVFVEYQTGSDGVLDILLRIVKANSLGEERVVQVPHEVFSSHDEKYVVYSWYGFEIVFEGSSAYLQVVSGYIDREDNSGTSYVFYRIDGDNFVMEKQFEIADRYSSYSFDFRNLLDSNFALVLDNSTGDFGVLNVGSGEVKPITLQGQERRSFPRFNSSRDSYIYSIIDEERSCFILNRQSVDSDLICRPYDWSASTGFMTNSLAFSPNGKYVALTFREALGQQEDLYIFDISGATPKVLNVLTEWYKVGFPIWSPDSKTLGFVAFGSQGPEGFQGGVYSLDVKGSLRLEYTNPEWTTMDSTFPVGFMDRYTSYPVEFVGWLK
jgi:Tol biopolymer transport system component